MAVRVLKTDQYMTPLLLLKRENTELLTNSSLMLIKGEVGSGKSRLAMNLMVGFSGENDNLGFEYIPCPEGKTVIYMSTEMSRYHLQKRLLKVLEQCPEGYEEKLVILDCQMDVDKLEVFHKLKEYNPHVIIIDQLADFIPNINDIESTSKLIKELCNGIESSDCGVIAILHQNEDSGINTKARGHLGSSLEQKVVGSIAISDTRDGFRIKTTKVREGVPIDIKAVFDTDTEMLKYSDAVARQNNEIDEIFKTLILPATKKSVCIQIGEYLKSDNYDTQNKRLNKMIELNMVTATKQGQSFLIEKV